MAKKIILHWEIFYAIFGIYLYVNFEVLLWNIISPDGFWGLIWFYSASVIGFLLFLTFLELIETILQIRKIDNINYAQILPIVFLYVIGSVIYFGLPGLLSKKLNDKYRYISKSEKYFSEGKFDRALFYAERVFEKSQIRNKKNPVLILPYIYENYLRSEKDKRIKLYQGTLNYAFCLQSSGIDIKR